MAKEPSKRFTSGAALAQACALVDGIAELADSPISTSACGGQPEATTGDFAPTVPSDQSL
jgi:hypothetical protein